LIKFKSSVELDDKHQYSAFFHFLALALVVEYKFGRVKLKAMAERVFKITVRTEAGFKKAYKQTNPYLR
jgi:hypothetical protein